jgi:hypothetical protein
VDIDALLALSSVATLRIVSVEAVQLAPFVVLVRPLLVLGVAVQFHALVSVLNALAKIVNYVPCVVQNAEH